MFLIRLLLLPFKIAFALIGIALKTGFRVGTLPFKVSGRVARVPRFRGWFFLLAGLVVGLLLAPGSGRELRAKLQKLLDRSSDSDGDVADKVSFELAHAPRTWHLSQPAVSVSAGMVTLRGTVPNGEGRDELGRVTAAVPGVLAVDNQIDVEAVTTTDPDPISPTAPATVLDEAVIAEVLDDVAAAGDTDLLTRTPDADA
jgi:hypothetical protein